MTPAGPSPWPGEGVEALENRRVSCRSLGFESLFFRRCEVSRYLQGEPALRVRVLFIWSEVGRRRWGSTAKASAAIEIFGTTLKVGRRSVESFQAGPGAYRVSSFARSDGRHSAEARVHREEDQRDRRLRGEFDPARGTAKRRDVRGDKKNMPSYSYRRKAAGNQTVAAWIESRFDKNFPGYKVEVLDGDGKKVHGKTLLSTVRDTYS